MRAGDLEAERLGHGPEGVAPAVVLGLDRRHRRARDLRGLADADLGHAGEPGAPQHGARAAGRDDPHAAAEHPQRRHVEVVEVQVRDEDGVEPRQDLRVRARAVADEVRHARAQHRIGEQARAADLERDGRVPDPGDPLRAGHAHTIREPRASAPHPRG